MWIELSKPEKPVMTFLLQSFAVCGQGVTDIESFFFIYQGQKSKSCCRVIALEMPIPRAGFHEKITFRWFSTASFDF